MELKKPILQFINEYEWKPPTCESCKQVAELKEVWDTYHGYKNSYCHIESAIKGFNCHENNILDHHSHKICIHGWRDKFVILRDGICKRRLRLYYDKQAAYSFIRWGHF